MAPELLRPVRISDERHQDRGPAHGALAALGVGLRACYHLANRYE